MTQISASHVTSPFPLASRDFKLSPTSVRQAGPWLQRADWLKFSADEALACLGTASAQGLAMTFPQAQGVLVTAGDRGCQYAIAGHIGTVPSFAVAAQEPTGAGDAFLAGVIYQLCQQQWQVTTPEAIEAMLRFANALGALTTLKPGAIAAQPTLEQVQAFLATVGDRQQHR